MVLVNLTIISTRSHQFPGSVQTSSFFHSLPAIDLLEDDFKDLSESLDAFEVLCDTFYQSVVVLKYNNLETLENATPYTS